MAFEKRLVRVPEVLELTGLSRSTLFRLEKRGEFPLRLRLGGTRVLTWYLHEVEAWRDERRAGPSLR